MPPYIRPSTPQPDLRGDVGRPSLPTAPPPPEGAGAAPLSALHRMPPRPHGHETVEQGPSVPSALKGVQDALAQQALSKFGPHPFDKEVGAPAPPVNPSGPSYNPFTGQWSGE